jgi:2-iminobutanoate/2-iminopropanoate deaminase
MTITRTPAAFPNASFSDAVAVTGHGRWIYVAGQVGLAAGASQCEGDMAAQATLCFQSIARQLERAGATLKDIVKITVFLRDLDEYAAFNAVRQKMFDGTYPASTGVQVAGLLLNAKVEVDAVAWVSQE